MKHLSLKTHDEELSQRRDSGLVLRSAEKRQRFFDPESQQLHGEASTDPSASQPQHFIKSLGLSPSSRLSTDNFRLIPALSSTESTVRTLRLLIVCFILLAGLGLVLTTLLIRPGASSTPYEPQPASSDRVLDNDQDILALEMGVRNTSLLVSGPRGSFDRHLGALDDHSHRLEQGVSLGVWPSIGANKGLVLETCVEVQLSFLQPPSCSSHTNTMELEAKEPIALLNLETRRPWRLHSPRQDPSLLRSVLAWHLGDRLGRQQPKQRLIDLWVEDGGSSTCRDPAERSAMKSLGLFLLGEAPETW